MTPTKFRKDRCLRATGYNFYVWAVVNVLVTWPLVAARAGTPWPADRAILYPIGCVAAGVFFAMLNDNRVQKMCGAADPQPLVEAGRIWRPVFLVGILLTVMLFVWGPAAYIQPMWLLLVGCAYLTWGNFGIREFQWLGCFLVTAGALTGFLVSPSATAWVLPSASALVIWVVSIGFIWALFGAYVNRKYLYGPVA